MNGFSLKLPNFFISFTSFDLERWFLCEEKFVLCSHLNEAQNVWFQVNQLGCSSGCWGSGQKSCPKSHLKLHFRSCSGDCWFTLTEIGPKNVFLGDFWGMAVSLRTLYNLHIHCCKSLEFLLVTSFSFSISSCLSSSLDLQFQARTKDLQHSIPSLSLSRFLTSINAFPFCWQSNKSENPHLILSFLQRVHALLSF